MNFRNAFLLTSSSQGVIIFLSIINSILITRVLGAEGRGFYILVVTIVSFLVLFSSGGLQWSNTYLVGRNRDNVNLIFSNSLTYTILLSIIIWGIFISLPENWVEKAVRSLPEGLLYPALFMVTVQLLSFFTKGILLGLQSFRKYNFFPILETLLFLLLNIFFLLVLKKGVEGVVYSWIFSGLVSLIFMTYALVKSLDHFKFSPDLKLGFSGIKVGSKGLIVNMLGRLLFRSDIFLVNYFLGAAAVGFYSVAVLIAELVLKIPSIGGTVLFPKVSSDREGNSVFLVAKISRIMVSMAVISSIFLLIFGKPLITLAYGMEFEVSYSLLVWLLPGIIGICVNVILDNYFGGKGYPLIAIYPTLIAVLVNIILNISLLPLIGVVGAAISTSVSYILMVAIKIFYFKNRNKITFDSMLLINRTDLREIHATIRHLFR